MTLALRIAQVAPVARRIRSPQSEQIEQFTAVLTDGLVEQGHAVTLFSTDKSETQATLYATFPQGYREDPAASGHWELREIFNLAAAVECAADFDVIHHHLVYWPIAPAFARLTTVPILQTMCRTPHPQEVRFWTGLPEAPYVAMSEFQAELLHGLNVVATINRAVDPRIFTFQEEPDAYCLFLGQFTAAEGVLHAIDVAQRVGKRLVLAGPANDYYRGMVAPHVDSRSIVYMGDVDLTTKAALLRGAQVLLCPVQNREPVNLFVTEAAMCGTPVAALDHGAVGELVKDGVTGYVFASADAMAAGLLSVVALDRRRVRTHTLEHYSTEKMVKQYVDVYDRLARHFRDRN